MSNRVDQLIEEIREKANLMKESVAIEKNKNSELSSEIDSLKAQIEAKSNEVERLKEDLVNLEAKLNDSKNERIEVQSDTGVSDEQIDELVKEIEYCITQLKK